jgi:CarboxypepD_reg-like domain
MKFAVIIFFFFTTLTLSQTKVTLSGTVKDGITNVPLINANVILDSTNLGTITDSAGKFELTIMPGNYKIIFSYVGYVNKTISVSLLKNIHNLEIELFPSAIEQKQIDVTGTKYPSSSVVQTIEGENIKRMPTILSDALRSVKILLGVVSNDELSSGYNVRGGNYDQNLIYLNEFEIHRPLLVKEGLEENQSLINQDFVKDIQFFPGGFPANLGDKISSALDINYLVPENESLALSSKINLLNFSVTISKKSGPLSWISGIRYSNPSLLGLSLQTKGNYRPEFFDFQLYSRYKISDKSYIDLLTIYAQNKYKLKPESWEGKYGNIISGILVLLDFDGSRNYTFNSGFYSFKYNNILNDNLNFTLAANYYNDIEKDNTDLGEDFYYAPNSRHPDENVQYLKSGFEKSNDRLNLKSTELKTFLNYQAGIHSFETGLDFSYSEMNNKVDEHNYQTGPDSTLLAPYLRYLNQSYIFRSASGFITDQITFSPEISINAGVRLLKYIYTDETLISPRIILFYSPTLKNTFNFNYGYYYQPPNVYELRDNPLPDGEKLISQKATHYIAGWEYRPQPKVKYQFQFFYKKMDDLIPYNIEKMQIVYLGSNIMKGYSYGFDFQYQGEIVEGLKTWIGYSYLNSKEKPKDGSSGYQRSLNDQTHTIKVFLQDRTKKHPNFQVHVRMIAGSGLLYHPQVREVDDRTGQTYLTYDLGEVGEFPFYLRMDMGMTFDINLKNKSKLTIIVEVLNIFDKKNIADYNWYTVLPYSDKYTLGVPQLFSRRFFNVGVKYEI